METQNDYHISFFKPTTDRAKTNRNMVVWLVSIWAIAIFGFHILLRVIEKPTPEPQLLAFKEVWNSVKDGNASPMQLQQFALSALHVTGKVFIKPDHRAALDNGISFSLFQLADSSQKATLKDAISTFESKVSEASDLKDPGYILAKNQLSDLAAPILELSKNDVLTQILPHELKSDGLQSLTNKNAELIETSMPLYMTHNRSVLTDTVILGFPFHYFYTAVFLLILFIGICWIYCYRVDKYNKQIGLSE